MKKISTKSNVTNMLTKVTPSNKFRLCLSLIRVVQEYRKLMERTCRFMDALNLSQGGELLCDSLLIKLDEWLPIYTFTGSYDFFSSSLEELGVRDFYFFIFFCTKRVRIAKKKKSAKRDKVNCFLLKEISIVVW